LNLNYILSLSGLLLATAAFGAGFVDAIVGGGGLLQIPALFSVFPKEIPATLFGINKVSAVGGTFVAATQYIQKVSLPKKLMTFAGSFAFVGSILGAWTVTQISPDFIRKLLPLILLLLLFFTLRNKGFGLSHQHQTQDRKSLLIVAFGSLGIGFYDGFFGPGTGAFFMFLFVRFLGFDFLHGAAATKIVNCISNIAALALFIPTGHIHWKVALGMMFFNILGGIIGSRVALRGGSSLVRIFFIAIVLTLTLKTANDSYHLLDFIR
jgi:uncharacterized membrane protein YfcA